MKQMMKVFVAAAMVLAFAVPASAQGTGASGVVFSAGVSFLDAESWTGKGVNLQVGKDFRTMGTANVGIVGDFGFHTADDFSVLTLAAGPRVSWTSGQVKPYVHVLLGMARSKDDFFDDSSTDFTTLFGGGVSFQVNDRVGVFGQYDLQVIFYDGTSENANRFTFGVTIR